MKGYCFLLVVMACSAGHTLDIIEPVWIGVDGSFADISSDGEHIVTSIPDAFGGHSTIRNLDDGSPALQLQGAFANYSEDGTRVVTSSPTNVRIYNSASGQLDLTIVVSSPFVATNARFFWDSQKVVVAIRNTSTGVNYARAYDAATGEILWTSSAMAPSGSYLHLATDVWDSWVGVIGTHSHFYLLDPEYGNVGWPIAQDYQAKGMEFGQIKFAWWEFDGTVHINHISHVQLAEFEAGASIAEFTPGSWLATASSEELTYWDTGSNPAPVYSFALSDFMIGNNLNEADYSEDGQFLSISESYFDGLSERHRTNLFRNPTYGEIGRPGFPSVAPGRILSGGLAELLSTDDERLRIAPGVTLMSGQPPIRMTVTGSAAFDNPSSIRVLLESFTSVSATQTIELYNYEFSRWDVVDVRPALRTEGLTAVVITENTNYYIRTFGGSGVQTRVSFKANGPVLLWPWVASIDYISWRHTPPT